MKPTRIAAVRYLNTTPLIDGLEAVAGLEIVPTVPSRIVGLMSGAMGAEGADIGLVSAVDVIRPGSGLVALPVGMIGCCGPTLTVRVFSERPLHEVSVLHADTDSHTSVVLASLLLAERSGRTPEVVDFDAREWAPLRGEAGANGWPSAVLLIGDKVATQTPPAVRYPHQLDLGEAWHEMTGLPFVYAVWACRAENAGSPAIEAAAALLDRQRRRNAMRLDVIATEHGRRLGWPDDLARRYLGTLMRYDVTDAARRGLERFAALCAARGLVAGAGVRWSDGAASAAAAGAM